MEPDAGHEEPDAGCGLANQPAYQLRGEGIAFPLDWSTCSANGCEEIRTVRLDDQAAMESFYQDELQETPPTVNFAVAELIVSYSCVCTTFGNTLAFNDIQADACDAVVYTTLTRPDENCFTQQTFTRPYVAVEVPKGTGVTASNVNQVTYACE